MRTSHPRAVQSGFTMIEVLVTLVILLLGLLGLAGLQTRAQVAETESYQRTQALVLARDMADRMYANPNLVGAVNYLTPTTAPLGTASTKDCSAPATIADVDLCAWDAVLKGAAETSSGSKVGAMIGARGCITAVTSPAPITGVAETNTYLIQVVWQGLAPTSGPPSSVACGGGTTYGSDLYRRAVTVVVKLADLCAPKVSPC
jgi:type IV pilus assembly protein PilV